MDHLMIDLETMGTAPDAPILAIGAARFDPLNGAVTATFYRAIDPADAFKHGVVSGETFKWWMKQADEARLAVIAGTDTLDNALYEFHQFYRQRCEGACVWGNGATFDISLLERAYHQLWPDQGAPWGFRAVRDCRTINDVASGLYPDIPRAKGVAHNALDDAIYQAEWVSAAWQALRNGR